MPESLESILVYIVLGLVALAIFIPLVKKLAWRLFRFDKEVEKILQQKKSSEVRLGKIAETLSPVLDDFPVDIYKEGTSTMFIGQPVDFIHFDPEEGVTFIEVKSGNSKLSASQQKLKELIEDGEVFWADYRVS